MTSSSFVRQHRGYLALALLLTATACTDQLLAVPDSSCSVSADCVEYSSCAFREGGCICEQAVCYVDPNSPYEDFGCRACHGSLENAAPPMALDGTTDTSATSVGAHQAHLGRSSSSQHLACSECHIVPDTVDAPNHLDGRPPAEVVFGPTATNRGSVAASWNRDTGTCSNYCHGATLSDGANTTPSWVRVDGSQAACGTCHGIPPQGNHPPNYNCEQCHAPTAGPNLTIANTATHLDGTLQLTETH